jgi:hypothetical protein
MNGEYKIAQYGQWDGYPEVVGVKVLSFLQEPENIGKLKAALSRVRFMEPDGRDKEFVDSYKDNAPEWSSDPDYRTEEQKHWFRTYISRDLGGDILWSVVHSQDEEILLRNSIGFAGDSLSCEYAYIVDLDTNTFEIYEGFNRTPITEGRFVSGDDKLEKVDGYEPVRLVKTYRIEELPSKEAFIADLTSDDDEEDAA